MSEVENGRKLGIPRQYSTGLTKKDKTSETTVRNLFPTFEVNFNCKFVSILLFQIRQLYFYSLGCLTSLIYFFGKPLVSIVN